MLFDICVCLFVRLFVRLVVCDVIIYHLSQCTQLTSYFVIYPIIIIIMIAYASILHYSYSKPYHHTTIIPYHHTISPYSTKKQQYPPATSAASSTKTTTTFLPNPESTTSRTPFSNGADAPSHYSDLHLAAHLPVTTTAILIGTSSSTGIDAASQSLTE